MSTTKTTEKFSLRDTNYDAAKVALAEFENQHPELECELVYFTGMDNVWVPPQMGIPHDNQLQGTAEENLVELAGRVCYDSLGAFNNGKPIGRPTNDYHQHIFDVGHTSVYEHPRVTKTVDLSYLTDVDEVDIWKSVDILKNKLPGFQTVMLPDAKLAINFNPCHLLNWDKAAHKADPQVSAFLFHALSYSVLHTFPNLIKYLRTTGLEEVTSRPVVVRNTALLDEVRGDFDSQWLSVYFAGSRGFSHEQVRHGDFTAISQRSTRYVDESVGEYVPHPLITFDDTNDEAVKILNAARDSSREAYTRLVSLLQGKASDAGFDRFTARKQARGAARGVLGNALKTEMIFSASAQQWKHMFNMRCAEPADAEIRLIYVKLFLKLLLGAKQERDPELQEQASAFMHTAKLDSAELVTTTNKTSGFDYCIC